MAARTRQCPVFRQGRGALSQILEWPIRERGGAFLLLNGKNSGLTERKFYSSLCPSKRKLAE
jgi:hypothetical protein